MTKVLLTGMSGTGKSTLIQELASLGYRAIDLDTDQWSHWVPVDDNAELLDPTTEPESLWRNQDWVWREDRVQRLLAADDGDILFVSGTAANQGEFYPRFDHITLLSAAPAVLVERLSSRMNNFYGKHPDELTRVLEHVQTVGPLLRRTATVEIDTGVPLAQVLETILNIVRP